MVGIAQLNRLIARASGGAREPWVAAATVQRLARRAQVEHTIEELRRLGYPDLALELGRLEQKQAQPLRAGITPAA